MRHVHQNRPGVRSGQGLHGRIVEPGAEPAERVLRAIDIQTGTIAWELRQTGTVNWSGRRPGHGGRRRDSWRGQRGADGRRRVERQGESSWLWSFQTSQLWKASPMTYMFDNKQYVAIAAGPNIMAFGLVE